MSGNPGTGTRKRTHWLPDGKTDRSAVANVGYARVSTLDQDLSLQLAQERPQARHHGRQAETRARDGRHGPDRARDRNTAESREDSALRGAQGRTRLTACPPLAVRSSEVAARDTTVGSGP